MTDLTGNPPAHDQAADEIKTESVAMTLFRNGDYKSARFQIESATADESDFLKRALAWDSYLSASIGVFAVIWILAVYWTAS
ncbi:MAG: hypothetical protein CMH52_05495 [Myxococcales bacterium]|nr:hypothetical protein [Myxococcales bacterium]